MPTNEGSYFHIYNKGADKRIIFKDEDDYRVFLGYLKEYLTAPGDPNSLKKVFSIRGRTFRGTPHLPKNYFNQIELVAYSLLPDHFHLLLEEKSADSIKKFLGSLSTRYSIYFNKKYKRTGALFQGSYRLAAVKDKAQLLFLTRYIHLSPKESGQDLTDGYSSYAQYLGLREISWIKSKATLALLGMEVDKYKDFVEKSDPDPKDQALIADVTIEKGAQHLDQGDSTNEIKNNFPEIVELPAETNPDPNLSGPWRYKLLAAGIIYLLLVFIGIKNVTASIPKVTYKPIVTSVQTEAPKEIPPKIILTVETSEGETVNIRQKPTTSSKIIGQAKEGDTFEYVSLESGWYEVKLSDGSTGFVTAEYIVKK